MKTTDIHFASGFTYIRKVWVSWQYRKQQWHDRCATRPSFTLVSIIKRVSQCSCIVWDGDIFRGRTIKHCFDFGLKKWKKKLKKRIKTYVGSIRHGKNDQQKGNLLLSTKNWPMMEPSFTNTCECQKTHSIYCWKNRRAVKKTRYPLEESYYTKRTTRNLSKTFGHGWLTKHNFV